MTIEERKTVRSVNGCLMWLQQTRPELALGTSEVTAIANYDGTIEAIKKLNKLVGVPSASRRGSYGSTRCQERLCRGSS